MLNASGRHLEVPRKVGLFTSPHLVEVRERIQIDGCSVSQATFAEHFSELWNTLKTLPNPVYSEKSLGYVSFLFALSLKIFEKEGVDIAVYETGVGGEYDVTNVIEQPIATGITSLAIDHVASLGSTIEDIAWHKGGIFKPGCPALSVVQSPTALEILHKRAVERNTVLEINQPDRKLRDLVHPSQPHQVANASLAAALFRTSMSADGRDLEKEVVEGLRQAFLPGRSQIVKTRGISWYVDIAHTEESLTHATRWFFQTSLKRFAISESSIPRMAA